MTCFTGEGGKEEEDDADSQQRCWCSGDGGRPAAAATAAAAQTHPAGSDQAASAVYSGEKFASWLTKNF